MSVYVRDGFLSAAECEEISSLHHRTEDGEVALGSKVRRVSRVGFFTNENAPEKWKHVAARLQALLESVNERIFHFELHGHEPLQFAEYYETGEYDWHTDLGPGSAQLRKLSVSVQLSDPFDYNGGHLEFWPSLTAPLERGTAIVFPSYLMHRVSPVTRGVRRSLVAWATGERPFR